MIRTHNTLQFFYRSLFSAKPRKNLASIDGEKQKKKAPVGIEPTTS